MKQDLVYRNTVSMLETERAATTRLTAENQALTCKLVEFQQITNEMSTKLQALETDLSIQTNTVVDLSEELQEAKAVLRDGEEERTQQSSTISSLKLEVGELQQKLHTLSRESDCDFQRNIKAIMITLNEKSRKIEALETELSRTRKEMEKVLEELRQDRCTALSEQAQEEVLKLQKQMCDDQDKIKTLHADLLQKEYNISYLQSEMRQANTRVAVLQKEYVK
ncbi:uncharacterized protein LOC143489205 [Brachyhypopomus gauderio]|uniref:uncharacterized protein LOC143489205 n=1 Tax=Brachyhypopomus gauderio TaxID=698409 RepID=UPI004041381D